MPDRNDIVTMAQSFNGYLNGAGYDGANQFSADLGHPREAWCADFVTDIYKRAGVPLPGGIQSGCATGFAYVPSALQWGRVHRAIVNSWTARPGDLVIFSWEPQNGVADHVEIAEAVVGTSLHTIGGNSGPSNVDGFMGRGGVHRHVWQTIPPEGNRLVAGVINADLLVTFGGPPTAGPPPLGSPAPLTRWLMLKSPLLRGDDVRELQEALTHDGVGVTADGVFGPLTNAAVTTFQRLHRLEVDGVVGPQTAAALGLILTA